MRYRERERDREIKRERERERERERQRERDTEIEKERASGLTDFPISEVIISSMVLKRMIVCLILWKSERLQ